MDELIKKLDIRGSVTEQELNEVLRGAAEGDIKHIIEGIRNAN